MNRLILPGRPGFVCGFVNCCEGHPEKRGRGDWHGIHGRERRLGVRDGDLAASVVIFTSDLPENAPDWARLSNHGYPDYADMSVHAAWPWEEDDIAKCLMRARAACHMLGACFGGPSWALVQDALHVPATAPDDDILDALEAWAADYFPKFRERRLDTRFALCGHCNGRGYQEKT